MGVEYVYANSRKAQFFHCGLLGWNGKFSGIGRAGPGARALAILLSDRGTWKDDPIAVLGESKEFDNLVANGVDIAVEVVLMLIEVDGLEWIEAELETSPLFSPMCELAIHLRRPDIVGMLERKFGKGKWQRRYETHLKKHDWWNWTQRVVDAANRQLKILR